MESRIDRRTFLTRSGVGAGALVLGGVPVLSSARHIRRSSYVPFARSGEFAEGVASGEPSVNGVMLWTRLAGPSEDRKLMLEIASDDDFRRVVYRRNVVARQAKDHAVNVRVASRRLRPGERYYYRFATRERSSRVGRFQTLRPADSREPLRLAFFSCQDWQGGYYGAHRTIAEIDDLDLVICLGDYIYERNFYLPASQERVDKLGANGDGEVQTLDEYRAKYRMYRSDGDLRAMHAAHSMLAIWDDHEVEDNYTGGRGGDKTLDRRIPFAERRSNGYKAFFEYMPVHRHPPGYGTYRRLSLGRSADLFLLDERLYRDDQPCGDTPFAPCPQAEDPGRRFLGDTQKEWFKNGLASSRASWKLVANQLMIMALDLPAGNPVLKDGWDGYGGERREVLTHVRDRGVKDLVFLTGDIHAFFAGDVGIDGRGPESVATEFVGGSISSLGLESEAAERSEGNVAPSGEQMALLLENAEAPNPHLRFDDWERRGYGLLQASDAELLVQFKAVEARPQRSIEARTIASFRVKRGEPRVEVL